MLNPKRLVSLVQSGSALAHGLSPHMACPHPPMDFTLVDAVLGMEPGPLPASPTQPLRSLQMVPGWLLVPALRPRCSCPSFRERAGLCAPGTGSVSLALGQRWWTQTRGPWAWRAAASLAGSRSGAVSSLVTRVLPPGRCSPRWLLCPWTCPQRVPDCGAEVPQAHLTCSLSLPWDQPRPCCTARVGQWAAPRATPTPWSRVPQGSPVFPCTYP